MYTKRWSSKIIYKVGSIPKKIPHISDITATFQGQTLIKKIIFKKNTDFEKRVRPTALVSHKKLHWKA